MSDEPNDTRHLPGWPDGPIEWPINVEMLGQDVTLADRRQALDLQDALTRILATGRPDTECEDDPVRWLSKKILALIDDAVRVTGDDNDNVGLAADVLLTAIGISWSLLRATSGQPETVEAEARKLGEAVQSMQAGKPWVVTEPKRSTDRDVEPAGEPKDTEHASDHWSGDALEAHYKLPWAMVGRVQCVERGPGGEPREVMGETIVRLVNLEQWAVRDPATIDIAIGGPWLPMAERGKLIETLAGAGLTPNQARELAQFLVEAADWADDGMAMPDHPFTRLAGSVRYAFECDSESWVMEVSRDDVTIQHDPNGWDNAFGWAVDLRKVEGRWEISGGTAELAANTRAATPAALESLLNLHGVPS